MNRALKALCLAGASLSLMMCNLDDSPDEVTGDEALRAEATTPGTAAAPPPCAPVSTQLTSGMNDLFAVSRAEVPTPRHAVQTWIDNNYGISGVRNYDEAHANQYFAHSFLFSPPTSQHVLSGATLIGRLQCRGSNDAFYTGFLDAVTGLPPAPYWGAALTAPPFSATCSSSAAPVVFGIDLASTPTTAQNLVPTMAANGFLDIIMQDDSQMDFLTLRLSWTCKALPLP